MRSFERGLYARTHLGRRRTDDGGSASSRCRSLRRAVLAAIIEVAVAALRCDGRIHNPRHLGLLLCLLLCVLCKLKAASTLLRLGGLLPPRIRPIRRPQSRREGSSQQRVRGWLPAPVLLLFHTPPCGRRNCTGTCIPEKSRLAGGPMMHASARRSHSPRAAAPRPQVTVVWMSEVSWC